MIFFDLFVCGMIGLNLDARKKSGISHVVRYDASGVLRQQVGPLWKSRLGM